MNSVCIACPLPCMPEGPNSCRVRKMAWSWYSASALSGFCCRNAQRHTFSRLWDGFPSSIRDMDFRTQNPQDRTTSLGGNGTSNPSDPRYNPEPGEGTRTVEAVMLCHTLSVCVCVCTCARVYRRVSVSVVCVCVCMTVVVCVYESVIVCVCVPFLQKA